MRKVWDVIVDLVYEDPWQFLGPLAAVAIVYAVARSAQGVWPGFALFALIGISLFLSLRRER